MKEKKKEKLILDKDAPVLRQVAKAVDPKDIGTKALTSILAKMKKALHAEDDGVAIAAPQIGESLRIFVVSGQALTLAKKLRAKEDGKTTEDMVFINPEIIKLSQKKKKMEEGCLSVRWLYGQVKRSEKITIKALNEKGEKVEKGASGLLSQIFQHEIDHLNGVLFIDKAENLEDLPPPSHEES